MLLNPFACVSRCSAKHVPVSTICPKGLVQHAFGMFLPAKVALDLQLCGFQAHRVFSIRISGFAYSNKKLLETSATLVVTGALLVVTRSY